MDLYLSPQMFAAARAEDLVLLDAAAGEYMLLPGVGTDVVAAADSNRLSGASIALAEALGELGALSRHPAPVGRRPIPPPPTFDLGQDAGPPASGRDLGRWLLSGGDMLRGYWRRPFGALAAAERAAPQGASDPGQVAAAARVFRRLLPWVPFQGECLFRSLMLRAYLRRCGLSATWVVGCQTWPFEAHCWLQVGPLVLDDTADHAAAFTPLLAL